MPTKHQSRFRIAKTEQLLNQRIEDLTEQLATQSKYSTADRRTRRHIEHAREAANKEAAVQKDLAKAARLQEQIAGITEEVRCRVTQALQTIQGFSNTTTSGIDTGNTEGLCDQGVAVSLSLDHSTTAEWKLEVENKLLLLKEFIYQQASGNYVLGFDVLDRIAECDVAEAQCCADPNAHVPSSANTCPMVYRRRFHFMTPGNLCWSRPVRGGVNASGSNKGALSHQTTARFIEDIVRYSTACHDHRGLSHMLRDSFSDSDAPNAWSYDNQGISNFNFRIPFYTRLILAKIPALDCDSGLPHSNGAPYSSDLGIISWFHFTTSFLLTALAKFVEANKDMVEFGTYLGTAGNKVAMATALTQALVDCLSLDSSLYGVAGDATDTCPTDVCHNNEIYDWVCEWVSQVQNAIDACHGYTVSYDAATCEVTVDYSATKDDDNPVDDLAEAQAIHLGSAFFVALNKSECHEAQVDGTSSSKQLNINDFFLVDDKGDGDIMQKWWAAAQHWPTLAHVDDEYDLSFIRGQLQCLLSTVRASQGINDREGTQLEYMQENSERIQAQRSDEVASLTNVDSTVVRAKLDQGIQLKGELAAIKKQLISRIGFFEDV